MRYNRDNVSVLVILDKRRAKKSGLFPVKIEVIFQRIQKYYPILVDMSEEGWNEIVANWDHLPDSNQVKVKFARACREVNCILDEGQFSFEALDDRYSMATELTLDKGMDIMRSEFYCEGKINSSLMVRYAMECVQRFAGVGVRFNDVNADWLKRFERFILDERKSLATVDIYMKAVKATYRRAIAIGYVNPSRYPFGRDRYVIPKAAPRSVGLSLEDLEKLRNYKGTRAMERYSDLWMFSYLSGGMNFRDLIFLQYRNIVGDEICYMPSIITVPDDSKLVHVPITDEMREILRRWGNPNRGKPGMYLFRYVKGRLTEEEKAVLVRKVICLCNRALRKISSDIGIPAFTTLAAKRSAR